MTSISSRISTLLAALLIFIAPLCMNEYKLPFELGAQVIGIIMLVVFFWSQSYKGKIGYRYSLFIVLSVCMVALYLIPISLESWAGLPGRELYLSVANFINQLGVSISAPALSLIPENTKHSLFYLLPLIALFLVTMSLDQKQIRLLVLVLFAIVFIEASLGIIQYASGSDMFYIGNEEHGLTASGSYRNRDHFTGLMELALPLLLAILIGSFRGDKSTDQPLLFQGGVSHSLIFLLLLILIILASFFAASRAGIGFVILGIIISSLAFSRHIGKVKSFTFLLLIGVIVITVALKVGVISILNRFASDPMEDERWRIFENTKNLISDMFPFGSGPGTFPDVYRAYQPIDQHSFINHGHNDYLELISDMGVFGLIIIVSFLLLYAFRWFQLIKQENKGQFQQLQVGAGIGLLLILLHSYVDFNLHQAANALVFVFLAGIFFRINKKENS